MQRLVIKKLFDSFSELEQAIHSAKAILHQQSNPPQTIICRIEGYESILDKQRGLAAALCGYAQLENWEEVTRHIKLINGLSAMIRDDAREIIAGIHSVPVEGAVVNLPC